MPASSKAKEDKTQTASAPKKAPKTNSNMSSDPLVGTRMRVWWAPTTNKDKTGFAGAYWPVKVLQKKKTRYTVEYDNGEHEDVLTENLAPDDPPIEFGEEKLPLQVGEFCEVSNASRTDPCAWIALVSKRMPNGDYLVTYPFHDAPPENIPPALIRRARVLDMEGWCLLRPGQRWKDGDVLSPHELETIKEEDLGKHVSLKPKESKPKDATPRNGTSTTEANKNKRSGGAIKSATARPTQRGRLV